VAGELDGPYEYYYENGEVGRRGTIRECGEWFVEGETVTYDPCPPDLEDGD
jgi:hypothetical protein